MREIDKITVYPSLGKLGKFTPGFLLRRNSHYVIGDGRLLTTNGKVYNGLSHDHAFHVDNSEEKDGESLDIILMGNMDKRPATKRQRESLAELCSELCKEYDIAIGRIFGANNREVSFGTSAHLGNCYSVNNIREAVDIRLHDLFDKEGISEERVIKRNLDVLIKQGRDHRVTLLNSYYTSHDSIPIEGRDARKQIFNFFYDNHGLLRSLFLGYHIPAYINAECSRGTFASLTFLDNYQERIEDLKLQGGEKVAKDNLIETVREFNARKHRTS